MTAPDMSHEMAAIIEREYARADPMGRGFAPTPIALAGTLAPLVEDAWLMGYDKGVRDAEWRSGNA